MSSDKIPVAKPLLGKPEVEAASRAILSGWVTQGPETAAFEKEFAAYVAAPFACAVSNCTTALHLALRAVGVKAGDEVITASHSFIATANSVRYLNAIPVFADIDPQTFNIDPAKIAKLITPKTRAILAVHQMGMPCDLKAILEIARKRDLPVVEDGACAIGSQIEFDGKWEMIGKPHGDIACFSFHPRKLLTTGDGGMLTTRNAEFDKKFRLWRQHSMSVPDAVRHSASQVIFEEYLELGYNYRMTDIQSAVGREQLKRMPEIIERRRKQTAEYNRLLSEITGLKTPHEPKWAKANFQSYCVRLPDGCDQRTVMDRMLKDGVSTRRGIMCAHREPAFRTEPWLPGNAADLRESERAQDRCIILPLFHEMTGDQQKRVADSLKKACARA
ncbi:MAG TPA: DegT/DnrJ/EryC1/StrS family aminotransferase [Planctomycetota bacterium]|nr:DegT/DnrJ/EryC1/StrS family aminotransferase [Planctomycetota bacterium]